MACSVSMFGANIMAGSPAHMPASRIVEHLKPMLNIGGLVFIPTNVSTRESSPNAGQVVPSFVFLSSAPLSPVIVDTCFTSSFLLLYVPSDGMSGIFYNKYNIRTKATTFSIARMVHDAVPYNGSVLQMQVFVSMETNVYHSKHLFI
jgi:hypothetical protein